MNRNEFKKFRKNKSAIRATIARMRELSSRFMMTDEENEEYETLYDELWTACDKFYQKKSTIAERRRFAEMFE